jgi:hypothetical protein
MKGERVCNGSFFPIRGDDKDIANLIESFRQDDDAFGMDAVIIGDQNLESVGHT